MESWRKNAGKWQYWARPCRGFWGWHINRWARIMPYTFTDQELEPELWQQAQTTSTQALWSHRGLQHAVICDARYKCTRQVELGYILYTEPSDVVSLLDNDESRVICVLYFDDLSKQNIWKYRTKRVSGSCLLLSISLLDSSTHPEESNMTPLACRLHLQICYIAQIDDGNPVLSSFFVYHCIVFYCLCVRHCHAINRSLSPCPLLSYLSEGHVRVSG